MWDMPTRGPRAWPAEEPRSGQRGLRYRQNAVASPVLSDASLPLDSREVPPDPDWLGPLPEAAAQSAMSPAHAAARRRRRASAQPPGDRPAAIPRPNTSAG